jgi:hypothetical protein
MGRALEKALELGLTGLESLLQRRDLLPAVARGHCCQTDQTDKWRRNFPDAKRLWNGGSQSWSRGSSSLRPQNCSRNGGGTGVETAAKRLP